MKKKDVIFVTSGVFSLFIWNSYLNLNGYFEAVFESKAVIKMIVSTMNTSGFIVIILNYLYCSRLNFYSLSKGILVVNYVSFNLIYLICKFMKRKDK